MATFEDILRLRDEASPTLSKIAGQMDNTAKKTTSLQKKLESIGKTVSSAGGTMMKYIALPLTAAGGAMVKLAMDMEQTTAVFTTLLGDAGRAQKMISDIQTLAAETPLNTRGLTDNAKLLLNFGYSAEKIIPALRMLGDIAGGNEQRFDSLALAFAQVQASGKLMGQDLLQMVNAGFNPLKIISEQTGISMNRLKDRMSKGKISFDMVEKAMMKATSQGGKFFGLMEKQSQTAGGRLSTLQDNVELLSIKLGTMLLPHVSDIIEKLIALVDTFDKLDPETQKWIMTIAGVGIASSAAVKGIGVIISGFAGLLGVVPKTVTAFGSLSVAMTVIEKHPVVFTITKITAALTALYKVSEKTSEILTNLFTSKSEGRSWGEALGGAWDGNYARREIKPTVKPLAPGESIEDRALSIKADRLGYGQTVEDRFADILKNQPNNQRTISRISEAARAPQNTTNNTTNMTNNFTLNGTVREEADIDRIGQSITKQLSVVFNNSGSY